MLQDRTVVLREAYRLIFDRKAPPDMSTEALLKMVTEGFSLEKVGVDLAKRCLLEIHVLQEEVPHEVYSDAHREIYDALTAHNAVGALD